MTDPANIFDFGSISGLSQEEAEKRLRHEGYNELPSARKRNVLAIAISVLREPMFLLLLACGGLYFTMQEYQEAAMLLGFVFVIMGITFYQERKTERALEALRDLSSPRALVIRDGAQRRIAGREVARGDILVLSEGDRVPADAVLLECTNLIADESLLTGESVPVRKMARRGELQVKQPGGDDQPFVYSGTLVVKGRGVAQVQAVGVNTRMGSIGKSLHALGTEDTLLQKETRRLVATFALVGLGLCIIVAVAYAQVAGWQRGFLAGLTLAMATLPEEFPVVLTIFLALGAWRISRQHVLTRRVPAVEMLGAATVLCVDKTGTLTLNRMAVRKLYARDGFYDVHDAGGDHLPEEFHELLEYSILAGHRDPFDPMEKAFKQLGERCLARTEHLHYDWTPVREYPLSERLLAMSHVWKSPHGNDYVIAAKGAPEAIADLCHFDEAALNHVAGKVDSMANDGLRVLGVARARFQRPELPTEQHDFPFEFVGLVGLADPIRPTVPDAIRECYKAGVRVIMVTGDYAATAQNIARQIGLSRCDECITGPELEMMDDAELRERVKSVNVFARTVPEQKLRLVNALKANNEVVAMTGDGVNDAPALKAAHIGVAMGGRGTDVAREAAALVLLDDDFSSIVRSVKMGRRIFDNIRKAMAYIFAIHVPIAGMSLIPVLLGRGLVLLPVHIVFLELIIDPACSIVFEAEREEEDVMTRPPRGFGEPMFGRQTILVSLLQGASVLFIVLLVYFVSLQRTQSEATARALTFTTLIIANLGLIMTNRSWTRTIFGTLRTPNTALWWVLGGALVFLWMVLSVPFLRDLFRFDALHWDDTLICFGAGVVSVAWFEVLKAINGWRQRRRGRG
ncbi:MAG TPA: cation-translocating P-type ATPase [Planctomycetota bacterium]|nr:cation-translocating P-type ATPase [Planctomycetota bacterium]